jgi:hypothetical protein
MFKRIALGSLCLMSIGATADAADPGGMKKRAVAGVEARAKLAQQINDQVFSFAELGYQEIETSRRCSSRTASRSSAQWPGSRRHGWRAGRTARVGL